MIKKENSISELNYLVYILKNRLANNSKILDLSIDSTVQTYYRGRQDVYNEVINIITDTITSSLTEEMLNDNTLEALS